MTRRQVERERRKLRGSFAAMVTPDVRQALERAELRDRMAEMSAGLPTVIETDGPSTITVTAKDGPITTFPEDQIESMVASLGDDLLHAVGHLVVSGSPYAGRVSDALARRLLEGAR